MYVCTVTVQVCVSTHYFKRGRWVSESLGLLQQQALGSGSAAMETTAESKRTKCSVLFLQTL